MRITPLINDNFLYRYTVAGNKVIDTFTNTEYIQASMSKANDLLNRLNKIGKQNAKIMDTSKGKGELLFIVA